MRRRRSTMRMRRRVRGGRRRTRTTRGMRKINRRSPGAIGYRL